MKFKALNLISLSGPFSSTSGNLTIHQLFSYFLPPTLTVVQPADISTVICCVTFRACAYIANSLSLQRLKFRLPDDKRYLLVHLMYINFYLAQISVMLVCLEIKNYSA